MPKIVRVLGGVRGARDRARTVFIAGFTTASSGRDERDEHIIICTQREGRGGDCEGGENKDGLVCELILPTMRTLSIAKAKLVDCCSRSVGARLDFRPRPAESD